MANRTKYRDWLARSQDKRLMQIINIKDKIPDYAPNLPFPQEKLERLILVCESYITLANYTEQARATAKALTKYEALINMADGGKRNSPARGFGGIEPLTLPEGAFIGLIPALRELVDDIKHCDNYSRGIGADLMILADGEEFSERNVAENIKMSPIPDSYRIRVTGKLYGMDGIRFDWRKKGADVWQTGVKFLTRLPGEIEIEPATNGEPEAGELRYILIDKNETYGEFSPTYRFVIG